MKSVALNGHNIAPSKIICIGRNYVEHIEELNNEMPTEPVIFLKPNSAIAQQLESGKAEEVHFEGEICFLIKNSKISAVGFGLDLTKRQVQSQLKAKGLPWERAKAFNKSAIFSQFVNCEHPLESYKMELFINGELTQHATYELMINKPEQLLTEVNEIFDLEDGDIIMTGTPKGVGLVNSGDKFTAKIYQEDSIIIDTSWVAL